jgi:hypothetical protein
MLRLPMHLGGGVHALLQHAPTNALLRRLQTRRGLKWSTPAMVIGVGYIYVAAVCTTVIDRGGPAWLNALVLLFIWNGFKLLWNGPVGLITLVRVRIAERHWARTALSSQ